MAKHLTDKQRARIVLLYQIPEMTMPILAMMFKVSVGTIHAVVKDQTKSEPDANNIHTDAKPFTRDELQRWGPYIEKSNPRAWATINLLLHKLKGFQLLS